VTICGAMRKGGLAERLEEAFQLGVRRRGWAYYTDTTRCTGDDDRIPILDFPDILQTLLRRTIANEVQ
jgi:hypothetical protein